MQKAKNPQKTQRGREVKGAGQEGGPARLNGAAGMDKNKMHEEVVEKWYFWGLMDEMCIILPARIMDIKMST